MPLTRLSLQSYNHTVTHYIDNRERFTLDAPYQRGSVWTDEHRRDLIKSMLMGLPVGAIVLNFRGYSSEVIYSVVDGKQRIETLRAFADDKFQVPAEWFEEDMLAEFETGPDDVSFGDLSLKGQRIFENLPINTLEARVEGIAAEAEVYSLINTAGVAQSDADLANAQRVASA